MNLSKIELQEMLREMGLKFSPDSTYEELRQMFQNENHRRWLGENRPDGPKRVIRRRRATSPAPAVPPPPAAAEARSKKDPSPPSGSTGRITGKTKTRPRRELPARRLKRLGGEPVVVDRRQNVFATVLRRAKRRCELCDTPAPENRAQDFLNPYHLVPLSDGGQEVIKNVVALCPGCLRKLESEPTPANLKILKRKARQKVISSVVVIRR
jgi:hypothetical protein